MAEKGFEVHRRAAIMYERINFYSASLPTILLSGISSVVILAVESKSDSMDAEEKWILSLIIAMFNAFNTVLIGIQTYWKWLAKSEKNRFAADEYDNLRSKVNLLKTKIDQKEASFVDVLREVEVRVMEIKKQCGPPDLWSERRYDNEALILPFQQVKRIRELQDKSKYGICWRLGFFFRWMHRMVRVLCRCFFKSEKGEVPGENNPTEERMLRQRLATFGQSDRSVHDLKGIFWGLLKTAAEERRIEDAKTLLSIIPNPVASNFMDAETLKRTPLHYAVVENFSELGEVLHHSIVE